MKMNIENIKKLRKITGASVMDCKRSLEDCHGDLKKAKEWLEKKALVKSEKKRGRETAEGVVEAYVHAGGKVAALVKLACETDFVARNPEFLDLAHELAMQVAAMKPKSVADFLDQEYIRDPKTKIKTLIKQAMAKFGENIKILEFVRLEI